MPELDPPGLMHLHTLAGAPSPCVRCSNNALRAMLRPISLCALLMVVTVPSNSGRWSVPDFTRPCFRGLVLPVRGGSDPPALAQSSSAEAPAAASVLSPEPPADSLPQPRAGATELKEAAATELKEEGG
jgi:hypothetical protein